MICKNWYVYWEMFRLAGYMISSKYIDSVNFPFLLYKWDNNLTSQGCPEDWVTRQPRYKFLPHSQAYSGHSINISSYHLQFSFLVLVHWNKIRSCPSSSGSLGVPFYSLKWSHCILSPAALVLRKSYPPLDRACLGSRDFVWPTSVCLRLPSSH